MSKSSSRRGKRDRSRQTLIETLEPRLMLSGDANLAFSLLDPSSQKIFHTVLTDITVNVVAENTGSVTINDGSVIDITLFARPEVGDDVLLGSSTGIVIVGALEVGGTQTITVAGTVPGSFDVGEYQIVAQVDVPTTGANEGLNILGDDPADNEAVSDLDSGIDVDVPHVDLTCNSKGISEQFGAGHPTSFTVGVDLSNDGNIDVADASATVTVEIFARAAGMEDELLGSLDVGIDGLTAGETRLLEVPVSTGTGLAIGAYELVAKVTSDSETSGRATNNTDEDTLATLEIVAASDVALEGSPIDPSPTHLVDGELSDQAIEGRVTNNGNFDIPAGAVSITVFARPVAAVDNSQDSKLATTVNAITIPAGSGVDGPILGSDDRAPVAGGYYLVTVVTVTEAGIEAGIDAYTNEKVETTPFTIQTRNVDLACSIVGAPTLAQFIRGESLRSFQVQITVKNEGNVLLGENATANIKLSAAGISINGADGFDVDINELAAGAPRTFTLDASILDTLGAGVHELFAEITLQDNGDDDEPDENLGNNTNSRPDALTIVESTVDLTATIDGTDLPMFFLNSDPTARLSLPVTVTVAGNATMGENTTVDGAQIGLVDIGIYARRPEEPDQLITTLTDCDLSGLSGGGTRTFWINDLMPAILPEGDYVIVAKVDDGGRISEVAAEDAEANNEAVTTESTYIANAPFTDLSVEMSSRMKLPASMVEGTATRVGVRVLISNVGQIQLPRGSKVDVTIYARPIDGGDDVVLQEPFGVFVSSLRVGRSKGVSKTVTLPANLGHDTYKIVAEISNPTVYGAASDDQFEDNNEAVTAGNISVDQPFFDLTAELGKMRRFPDSIISGVHKPFTVPIFVKNAGNAPIEAGEKIVVGMYLRAPNGVEIPLGIYKTVSVSKLRPGASRRTSVRIKVPDNDYPTLWYTIVAKVDDGNTLEEGVVGDAIDVAIKEGNNSVATERLFINDKRYDLHMVSVSVKKMPQYAIAGDANTKIRVSMVARNEGTIAFAGRATVKIYAVNVDTEEEVLLKTLDRIRLSKRIGRDARIRATVTLKKGMADGEYFIRARIDPNIESDELGSEKGNNLEDTPETTTVQVINSATSLVGFDGLQGNEWPYTTSNKSRYSADTETGVATLTSTAGEPDVWTLDVNTAADPDTEKSLGLNLNVADDGAHLTGMARSFGNMGITVSDIDLMLCPENLTRGRTVRSTADATLTTEVFDENDPLTLAGKVTIRTKLVKYEMVSTPDGMEMAAKITISISARASGLDGHERKSSIRLSETLTVWAVSGVGIVKMSNRASCVASIRGLPIQKASERTTYMHLVGLQG